MKKQILVFFILLISALWIEIHPLQLLLENDQIIHVSIQGAVKKETTIELPLYSTVKIAIEKIEVLDDADMSVLNMNSILKDGDVLNIPYMKQENELPRISINTGNLEELCTLNGIGEGIAQRIIDYRDQNGSFQSIEDLMKVKGIGEKKFEKIKDDITL